MAHLPKQGDFKPEVRAEVEAALRDYSHASFALAKLLQRRAGLTDLEQLMIDNNLAIVQLNYAAWMRKSNESNPFPEAC